MKGWRWGMLQVWLPLNGNLNNQGLADVSVTSGTAKYKTGKIGNGLDLSSRIMFSCPKLVGLKQFTIMFWVKIEDDDSIASNWQDIFGIYEQKADGSSYGQFRAETYYTPKTVGLLGVHWHDNTNYGITSGTLPTHYTGDRGVWHHCAIVVDSDQFIKSYTDGVLKNEYTTGLKGGHLYNGVFWLGETNNIAGCVNDVRIYDHVLSPREVKEISKGLVLHYPLSMPGQENLLVTQISDNKWVNWRANATWDSTNTREKILGDDGKTWAHIIQNTTDGYGGYACDPSYNQIVIDSSKRYTWSCIAKAGTKENAEIILWCHWRSTEGGNNLSQNSKKFQLTSNPQRISWTLPQYTNATYTVNRINLMMGTSGTGNNEIYFTDVKFEEGSRPTPWLPNPADAAYSALGFNDGIEYDVSGYNHNGTKHGVITYDADTPRYGTSAVFNGTNGFIEAEPLPIETKTISVWVKTPWASSSGYKIPVHDKTTGLAIGWSANQLITYIGSGNGGAGSRIDTSGIWTANKWHHVVIVKTGDTTRNVYIDGLLISPVGANYWGGDLNKLNIGARHISGSYKAFFDGQLADFRAYTTALSADDVRDLYAVAASISNNGTLVASEVSEL